MLPRAPDRDQSVRGRCGTVRGREPEGCEAKALGLVQVGCVCSDNQTVLGCILSFRTCYARVCPRGHLCPCPGPWRPAAHPAAEGCPLCRVWETVLPCGFFLCRAGGLRQQRAPAPSGAPAPRSADWHAWGSRLMSGAASEAAAIGGLGK